MCKFIHMQKKITHARYKDPIVHVKSLVNYGNTKISQQFSSVQFDMVSMQSEKPILYAPLCPSEVPIPNSLYGFCGHLYKATLNLNSEVSPTLPLKTVPMFI